jgi:hypothetical protein
MNNLELSKELTRLLMESYDRGAEDAKAAALEAVEKTVAAAVAAEREACAKLCEEPGWNAANWCAKQIRARGEK